MITKCEHCSEEQEVSDSFAGKKIECENCHQRFNVKAKLQLKKQTLSCPETEFNETEEEDSDYKNTEFDDEMSDEDYFDEEVEETGFLGNPFVKLTIRFLISLPIAYVIIYLSRFTGYLIPFFLVLGVLIPICTFSAIILFGITRILGPKSSSHTMAAKTNRKVFIWYYILIFILGLIAYFVMKHSSFSFKMKIAFNWLDNIKICTFYILPLIPPFLVFIGAYYYNVIQSLITSVIQNVMLFLTGWALWGLIGLCGWEWTATSFVMDNMIYPTIKVFKGEKSVERSKTLTNRDKFDRMNGWETGTKTKIETNKQDILECYYLKTDDVDLWGEEGNYMRIGFKNNSNQKVRARMDFYITDKQGNLLSKGNHHRSSFFQPNSYIREADSFKISKRVRDLLEKGIENLNIYLGVSEIEEGFKPQSFDALSTIKLEVPKKYTELSYFKKEQMSSDDDIDALTAEKREELFGTVTGKLHGQDFKPNMIKFKKNGEFIISQGKIGSMWGDSVVQIWITSLKESIQHKNVELKELHMKGIEMGVKENSQSSWAKTEFYKDCDYIIKFGKIEGKYLHGKIDIKFNDKDNSYVKGNFKSLIVEH